MVSNIAIFFYKKSAEDPESSLTTPFLAYYSPGISGGEAAIEEFKRAFASELGCNPGAEPIQCEVPLAIPHTYQVGSAYFTELITREEDFKGGQLRARSIKFLHSSSNNFEPIQFTMNLSYYRPGDRIHYPTYPIANWAWAQGWEEYAGPFQEQDVTVTVN